MRGASAVSSLLVGEGTPRVKSRPIEKQNLTGSSPFRQNFDIQCTMVVSEEPFSVLDTVH